MEGVKRPPIHLSPQALLAVLQIWPHIPSLEVGHLLPANIAMLHSYTHGTSAVSYLESRSRLSELLLAATLDFVAKHIPIYRRERLIPTLFGEGICPQDVLKSITPVDRQLVQANSSQFVATNTTFSGVTFTSGTSTGVPLMCERSVEEINWLGGYQQYILNHHAKCGLEPLCLSITTANHGSTVTLPGRGYAFPLDLRERSAFQRAQWLLNMQFRWAGYSSEIQFITGSFRKVYLLGLYLANHNALPRRGQILGVQTYGSYANPEQKKQLEMWFHCAVTDIFSMSEFLGASAFCEICQGFHMPPMWYTEILTNNIMTTIGELVVTPLFPFVRRFFPLRYRTGDLFQLLPGKCQKYQDAFRYLGRVNEAIFPVAWKGAAFPSTIIVDVLSDIPDVSRDRTSALEGLLDAAAGKAPEFITDISETGTGMAVLKIKLVYDPILFSGRVNELENLIRRRLHSALLELYPNLSIIDFESNLSLSFVGPNHAFHAPDNR